MSHRTAIWWIRRDLRLTDNPALLHALEHTDQVIPLFVLDDTLLNSPYASEKRSRFMLNGLRSLERDIEQRGGRLILRRGSPRTVLQALCREAGVDRIVAERDFSPYAHRRDSALANEVPLTLVSQPAHAHPDDVLKADGTPYTVFTPYAKRWKSIFADLPEIFCAPDTLRTPDIGSPGIPVRQNSLESVPFTAGEETATRQLETFTSGPNAQVLRYAQERDRLDLDATSRLSPYLRFGMISARQAIHAAMTAIIRAPDSGSRTSAESWLNELIWREFSIAILHHFPHVRGLEFKDRFRDLPWLNDPADIDAWIGARTGYPIVDACMRQLHADGWLHNRGRMITASFLVKHLLVDWRIGERHFMQHLVDGDPAANNGGWQWTAGTGTDSAPYFRIFNPIAQSQRHDPHGHFIRKWLPELADVPDRSIHEPWKMSPEEQQAAGCLIGQDYPEPIIDHNFARQRALAAYRRRPD